MENSGQNLEEKVSEKRSELVELFEDLEDLRLAYLFGSVAREESGRLSDIDFGIYVSEESDKDSIREKLFLQLSDLLGDEIDIVLMNDAPMLLKFNIIKEGDLIYSDSNDFKVSTESDIMRKYLDKKYYDERHVEKKLEIFANEGLA